ncbi:hypothetical protein [Streptomyces piniterrae]|nr:hypothetical protein [Streptomyces piniterrae]
MPRPRHDRDHDHDRAALPRAETITIAAYENLPGAPHPGAALHA